MENKKNNIKELIPLKKPFIQFNNIVLYVKKLLSKKYFVSKTQYERYLIKNIIYDERNKLVSTFKEHLIMNDISEFIKRYYTHKESLIRLKKYYDFYSNYSKLFPNYIPLYESKYIYKNIHKKQKIIDMQQNEMTKKRKEYYNSRNNKTNNNKIFNSEIYESIIKNSENYISIFGINKYEINDKNNDDSASQILNIINSIDKYKLEFKNEYNNNNNNFKIFSKYHKQWKNKNIIINNYYYNNSSILTKQSAIPSFLAQHQKIFYKNEKMFSILNNNILIGLRKKKKTNYKNNFNNSTTFKNLISFGLINNNNDDIGINKKNKYIKEGAYSLFNSFKNNKSISNINKSINILNNSKANSNNKNKKSSTILKNKIQKYIKPLPKTARIFSSQNKKIIDEINKLNSLNNNSNFIRINAITKKSSINSLSGNLIKKKKKKINFNLINKIFLNKTNCLSDRTSHYFEDNSNKIKKHKLSGNKKIKKGSNNNTSRNNNNNNDKNQSKKYYKFINKNKNILSKKKIKINDVIIKNSFNKNNNLKYLTCKFLKSNTKFSNSNIEKTISIKKKNSNLNIKTERENLKKKKYNELDINQIIKIKKLLHEKIEKSEKTITGINYLYDYNFINRLKNKKSNKKDFKIKSFIKNEDSLIDFKNNLLSNNKDKIIKKCYYTIENSIDNSNNEIKKDYNYKLNSSEKFKNSKNYIINNNNININHNKKSSVIKIKGIKIKNFNKIFNINKDKSKSNSSKKSNRINKIKNYLSKIPKKKKSENLTKRRIMDNIIKIKTSQKKKNSLTYNYPQSLTERERSKKSKKIRILE